MEINSESNSAVEIKADFLSSISSADQISQSSESSARASTSDSSTRQGNISVSTGTLMTVNSLNARAVARLLRYVVGQRRPPVGEVVVLNSDLGKISKREILRLRRRMGIVGGEFGLITELSVSQNLALPCMIRKLGRRQTQMRVERISEALNLGDLLAEPVVGLGVIERRVALIARALTHDPELIILEAPLSGLDERWSSIVVEHFKRLSVTGSTALLFHEYTGAFEKGA